MLFKSESPQTMVKPRVKASAVFGISRWSLSSGLNLDRSRLHLLRGDLEGRIWDDITGQVVLEFTHLYAVFEVTHFSW